MAKLPPEQGQQSLAMALRLWHDPFMVFRAEVGARRMRIFFICVIAGAMIDLAIYGLHAPSWTHPVSNWGCVGVCFLWMFGPELRAWRRQTRT